LKILQRDTAQTGRALAALIQARDTATDLSQAEWLGLLVDREVASRETKRFEARMRSARLRHVGACAEDVDYRARRGLDKALFQSLLTDKWITDKRNVIITGPCGVGKTWLGCAFPPLSGLLPPGFKSEPDYA
jgi:DNA replication protein DnaC